MKSAASTIFKMLNENMKLFDMTGKTKSATWKKYLQYIDSIISGALLRTIGCRYAKLKEKFNI